MKKLFLFLIMGMFIISTASALEFDNVKTYNSVTRVVEIKNAFGLGDTIGQAELLTPLNVKVGAGYQKVAEFEINSLQNYDSAIKDFSFIDMKSNNEIERDIDIKYKTYETITINDYKTVCEVAVKGANQTCEQVVSGTHEEERISWVDIGEANLKESDNLIIGIFTDVQFGDYIDWIPTIYGVEVEEWATWEADLNTDLISYYKLDNSSGVVYDMLGTYDGTNSGMSRIGTGLIGGSFSSSATTHYIDFTDSSYWGLDGNNVSTRTLWINPDSLAERVISHSQDINVINTINLLANGSITYRRNARNVAGEDFTVTSTDTISVGEWSFIVIISNATNNALWVNGVYQGAGNSNGDGTGSYGDLTTIGSTASAFIGDYDEMGVWGRELSSEEIEFLYNNGTGLTYGDDGDADTAPTITLNSPASTNYTTTPQSLTINFTASDDLNLTDVKLYVNDVLNQTNTSGINNTDYLFDLTLGDGTYTIYGTATDNKSQSTNSSEITIMIDGTLPEVNVTAPSGALGSFVIGDNETLNYSIADDNLDSCWYVYNLSEDSWPSYTTSGGGIYFNFTSLEFAGLSGDLQFGFDIGTGRRSFLTEGDWESSPLSDTIKDCATETYADTNRYWAAGQYSCLYNGSDYYMIKFSDNIPYISVNLTFSFSPYLDTVTSLNCSETSTEFTYIAGLNNLTVYAEDVFGNINSNTTTWSYKLIENSLTYNNETISGSQETFTLNVTASDGYSISSANLIFGNNTISSAIYQSGDNILLTVENYEIESFETDTNVSLYYSITLDDDTVINSSIYNALVLVALIDNCSTYTNQLFNISLYDEQTKTPLLGNIEISYSLLNVPSYEEINTLSLNFENTSNALICSDINLTDKSFVQSAEIRYYSDEYSSELYHIQRAEISEATQQINLYDLNSSEATQFKITYQDSNFNFVEGAIIQLQRKYISEGIYETVEAPLTSSEGIALVSIDLDSIKYRATVVKNGVVLDEFDNLVFKCQSELTGECDYKLLGEIDPQNEVDLSTILDFYYTEPTISNNTITVSFSIPSGTPSVINLVLEQKDEFGNETLCNRTITSSAGSISCEYSESLGDSYIDLLLSKNGVPLVRKSYILNAEKSLDWLGNNYVFILVLLLSLVGMALSSPEWIIINGIITMVISGGLYLASGLDFVTGLGTIMWLVIAAVIIISKMSKQEDR